MILYIYIYIYIYYEYLKGLIVLPHGGQGGRLLREVVSQLNDVRVPVVPRVCNIIMYYIIISYAIIS